MARRRQPRAGPPLGVALGCALLSLLLHALALTQTWQATPLALPAASASRPVSLRVAPSAQSVAVPAPMAPRWLAPQGRLASPTEAARETVSGLPQVDAAGPELPDLKALAGLPSAPVLGEWDAYIPRPLLSKAPQPQDTIFLAWPEDGGENSHYEAVAALYIDEVGVVQALRLQSGDLPESLLAMVKKSFEGRRFHPGELHGQAVKSRVYIELSFDQAERVSAAPRGLQQ